MPRPKKNRTVCNLPYRNHFGPINHSSDEMVMMTVDEYETIRLIDKEKLTQQECANQMQVSRATVQSIYDEARSKLADCIVHGKRLLIEGGDYQLCSGKHLGCCRRACKRFQQPVLNDSIDKN